VNWQTEGDRANVRGSALNLLTVAIFKGENQQRLKSQCKGGYIQSAVFVRIKSYFLLVIHRDQVVTIFGANHPERHVMSFRKINVQSWVLDKNQLADIPNL